MPPRSFPAGSNARLRSLLPLLKLGLPLAVSSLVSVGAAAIWFWGLPSGLEPACPDDPGPPVTLGSDNLLDVTRSIDNSPVMALLILAVAAAASIGSLKL